MNKAHTEKSNELERTKWKEWAHKKTLLRDLIRFVSIGVGVLVFFACFFSRRAHLTKGVKEEKQIFSLVYASCHNFCFYC